MRFHPTAFGGLFLVVGACAASDARSPEAVRIPPPAVGATEVPAALVVAQPPPIPACEDGRVPDSITRVCVTACGLQPESPQVTIDPTCSVVTLRDGRSDHDQLTLQLSSGATTRIDCPRMRFRGQDTPVCITRTVGGHIRGACCPPGHTDPTDPECVAEGSVDEMFKRKKVWEWCDKTKAQQRPCEPCVWVTGAER